MDRKEFISQLGIGAAFVLTSTCLGGCLRESRVVDEVDLILDLNDPANSDLLVPGGFIVSEGVVVAQTIQGEYVAATLTCSHEQLNQITFDAGNNKWFCTAHSAEFSIDGQGLNANGSKGLAVFTVELDVSNNTLKVFS